jgi:RecB family exonuclease
VEAAQKGVLVLTATGRLSRRILHCLRQRKIEERSQGWETPAVFSFNRWVKDTFDLLWTPFHLLSKMGALRLWHEAAQRVEPLEGLSLTPSLYLELQDTLDVLTRHQQEVTGTQNNQILPSWRRNISRHFLTLLGSHKYLSWAEVLNLVGKAIAQEKVSLPENIILAGFDESYPIEKTFMQILREKSHVAFYCARKEAGTENKVRVYATPEQECQAICAEVLNIWNEGQRRLGIVFLDENYFGLIKRCLDELTDREERPPYALRYNLTMGTPLSEHPLFQTAILPLRLLDAPVPNCLLSSLLCSLYVTKQRDDWDYQVKIILWAQDGVQNLNHSLARLCDIGFPVKHIQTLSACEKQPFRLWLEVLESLWGALGFPICRCETDTLAKEHLFVLIEELKKKVGNLETSREEVLAWFMAASQGIEVVEKTPETAGIQVLNVVESRGLAFDWVWVVGTHGRVLPEPVRDLPFLDPNERRMVQGGTVEGQWESAKRHLSYLLASSPTVTFSRAASRGEDEPFLPCPLIPDESLQKGSLLTIDLWKDPPQEWMRARWLREGLTGLSSVDRKVREEANDRVDTSLPQVLRVTNLEELLACPFKFFASNLLGLAPLVEPETGINPLERGETIHRILRDFMRGLLMAVPDWPLDGQKALEFLKKTVEAVLAEKPDSLFWKVERLRLLGDDTFPGLLSTWLEQERERALEGWRFEVAEEPFEGLAIGDSGVMLTGQVDRIDSHPIQGIIIWDYKTGEVPTPTAVFKDKVAPQLPSYLLSLKRDFLHHIGAQDSPLGGGYISLKKVSEVKISPMKDAQYWEEFLSQWEGAVQERLKGPLNGLYLPEPRPAPPGIQNKGACTYCVFFNLCAYHDNPEQEVGKNQDRSDEA